MLKVHNFPVFAHRTFGEEQLYSSHVILRPMVTRAIRTLLPPPKGGWDKKFWCAMKFFASEANETNFRRKTSHVPFGWRSRESKYPDPTKGGESASFGGVVKMALTALGDAALVFRMTCNFPDSNRVSLGLLSYSQETPMHRRGDAQMIR